MPLTPLTPRRAGGIFAVLVVVIVVPLVLHFGGRERLPAAAPSGSASEPLVGVTVPPPVAEGDGALRFGAVSAMALPVPGQLGRAAETAWLFGALLSGGRMAEAHAMLSSAAREQMPLADFSASFRQLRLLRGSDDAPWRVPGSDVFLFNMTDPAGGGSVKGELRVGLEESGGQWRVVTLRLWNAVPAVQPAEAPRASANAKP